MCNPPLPITPPAKLCLNAQYRITKAKRNIDPWQLMMSLMKLELFTAFLFLNDMSQDNPDFESIHLTIGILALEIDSIYDGIRTNSR